MVKDSITFIIDQNVYLEDFTRAIDVFNDLIKNISKEVCPGQNIKWILDDLRHGSACAVVKGVYETEEEKQAVSHSVDQFEKCIHNINQGDLFSYSHNRQKALNKLISLSRQLPIQFNTEDHHFDLAKIQTTYPNQKQYPIAFGAVTGRIQGISNRGSLRFVLYDHLYDNAVTCYMEEGKEEEMKEMWGCLAQVEGYIKREPSTGKPLSIRHISNTEIIPESEKGAWKKASGCVEFAKESRSIGAILDDIRDVET